MKKIVDCKELALKKVNISGNVIGKFGTFEIENLRFTVDFRFNKLNRSHRDIAFPHYALFRFIGQNNFCSVASRDVTDNR